MTHSPCLGCTNRSADPNCHNANICQAWADYTTALEKNRAKVIEARNKYADEARQVRESKERVRKHRHKQR